MKKIITLLFTLALLSISIESFTNGSGPGGGLTNAPSEDNCTQCHSGSLITSGSNYANLKMEDNFTGGGYIPDSTYTLKVKMSQSSISKWGFNVTALYGSSNLPAGDFTNISTRTQRRTKSFSGKTRVYIEHTSSGTSSTSSNNTEWEFKWTAPSSNVGDISYYVALNAANGNGSVSGDNIYAKVFNISPSSLLPSAKIVSSDTVICAGKTVDFSATVTNSPTSYSWVFPNGSPSISTDKNPTVNYNFQGNQKAILRVKNAKGWSKPDTFLFKVLASPTAFISGAAVRKICRGTSIKLTAQFDASNSYLWSNSKTGNEITVSDTGTYYVFVKSSTCEKVSNSIKVEYYNDAKVDLSSSYTKDSICAGDLVTLSSTAVYDSFFWYRNEKQVAATDTNFIHLNIDSSGFYAVKAKDSNGCFGTLSDSIHYTTVRKETQPVVTCQNQDPFSVDFDWTGSISHGVAQISINKGVTWLTPSSGSAGNFHSMKGLNPEQDYELWVRGAIPQPCFYTNITKKVCKTGKCSPLEAFILADSMVCDGDELQVEINGLSKENFSLSFEGGAAFTDTIFKFTPQIEKTYTIEVLDSAYLGCPAKKLNFPIHIDKIDQILFETQRPNNTFCTGDTVQFSANAGNEGYSFFVNNTLRHTSSDSFYYENKFADGDSAYVEVVKGACKETSELVYLNVVPVPTATFTFDSTGSQYTFIPDVPNYKSYFWDFGDGFTSVLKEPDHSYLASSNQTVNVTLDVVDNNNCGASGAQRISLPDFSSIHLLTNSQVRVYPSPATNVLNIDIIEGLVGGRLVISDMNGVQQIVKNLDNKINSIDISKMPTGLYYLEITSPEGRLIKKLFKL